VLNYAYFDLFRLNRHRFSDHNAINRGPDFGKSATRKEILMCNPMSWIDKDGVILFLIGADLETERGRKLIKYTQNRDDLCGHGAIRYFYGTESESGEITPMIGGIDKEVIDFDIYLFKKLPLKIKMAIGTGEMRGIWCGIKGLLRAPLYADYEAKRDTLDADYKAKRAPLYADYKAKRDTLFWDLFAIKSNRLKRWR
jgi:hypothetical protein